MWKVCLCLVLLVHSVRGQLYGLTDPTQLVTINEQTGELKAVGPTITGAIISQELSAIDSQRNIFYAVSYNASTHSPWVLGLSLLNGTAVINIPLPFTESVFVGAGQAIDVVPHSGELVVTGRVDDEHHVVILDPHTGKTTTVAKFGDIDVLGAASCFDPLQQVEYLMMGVNDTKTGRVTIDLVAVHIRTGKIANFPTNPQTGATLTTMNYDPSTKSLVGLSLRVNASEPSQLIRTVGSFEIATGRFHTHGDVKGYLVQDGEESAYDPLRRKLYVYLSAAAQKKPELHLVAVDAASGKVLSASEGFCSTGGCPWALEFREGIH